MPRPALLHLANRGGFTISKPSKLRVNHEIRSPMVRLIDEDGKMIGTFQVPDAIRIAFEKGLDLIEIAPDANPPTCKIMDFGKYKYELKKKAAEGRKKQVVIVVKEVQFTPNTDKHDFDFKVRNIQRFLGEGNKVRIVMNFRGREITHQEAGRAMLKEILEILAGNCVIEQPPSMEGKKLGMMLAPGTGKPAAPGAAPAKPAGTTPSGGPLIEKKPEVKAGE